MLRKRVAGTAMALLFVFGPAVGYAVGWRQEPADNRAMAPTPSAAAGFAALEAVGPWASDRLAARSSAVRAKSWFDFNVLRQVPPSGKVIRGSDGYLFLGEDFTKACTQTPGFREGLDRLGKLAAIIEKSGRKAVFTVGPNKSSVVTDALPSVVPKGECASEGLETQNQILDSYRHPSWLGVRKDLTDSQTYWKTDSHWSSAGSAVFARSLAAKLNPSLAARLTMEPESTTKTADLNVLLGLTGKETPPGVQLSTGGTVTPAPGSAEYDPLEVHYGQQKWTTCPATGLIPGRTVIIGDSFAYTALGNLRPLFADGHFLWTGHVTESDLITAIKAADTVIIEVVQRSITPSHPFANPTFHQKVAAALG
ncbi:acetyltransferase AlgX (SGNH hydrolase-like protein) [Kribbella amoyensis]|uniref:Acetyltransferase AlgX (SGNH hydrolase-like protein) n=1 Tax=Kribbella amoyensis TaxID=996641 RepID=A0A561BVG8_9ACTN|nr:hypothetical protein [Kribbella amoyensis]TWD82772.1 acetyltransferase AlgX (SGNH hydrolase-like protein) [Kribbella amoyensis]